MEKDAIKDIVKSTYRAAAKEAAGGRSSTCGTACCGTSSVKEYWEAITGHLYGETELAGLPEQAILASLGCGNPTALAQLNPGETVLDLGSGGGIDVLLSAKRVGPAGKAYGLDMTDEMLALARDNQRKAGVDNVEFLKGDIEQIPLPDDSIDVIISNCVINLSPDKDRVFAEAFRVLKPGGRLAVSDVVAQGPIPADIRPNIELWTGCVAGALEEADFHRKLAQAGFTDIGLEPTRVYRTADAWEFLSGTGLDVEATASRIDGLFFSAFVRASKPRR